MFDKIKMMFNESNMYKLDRSIFPRSHSKHLLQDEFLIALGLYIKHVQSNRYSRKMRTALLWSTTSALYLSWGLFVGGGDGNGDMLKLWGLEFGKIKQENILLVLLLLTGGYTIRFLLLVAKAFGFVNPFFLIRPLYRRKKLGVMAVEENTNLDRKLCYWLEQLLKSEGNALDKEIQTRSSKKLELAPGEMQCVDQARFMVAHPTLGLLENFFFSVLAIPVFCSFVVLCLALEPLPEKVQVFAMPVLIILTLVFAVKICRSIIQRFKTY